MREESGKATGEGRGNTFSQGPVSAGPLIVTLGAWVAPPARPFPPFNEAAIDAVGQWRCDPVVLEGEPADVIMTARGALTPWRPDTARVEVLLRSKQRRKTDNDERGPE